MNTDPQATTALFSVPDMSCGHCEKAIRAALSDALPGAEVKVDLAAGTVAVEGDRDRAEAAIREAGYSPEPLRA